MSKFSRRGWFTAGAALAASSPLLSMMTRRALAQPLQDIRRVVFWFVPEGVVGNAYWPGHGPGAFSINANATMGNAPLNKSQTINSYRSQEHGTWILGPMKPHEADMTLVSGLHNNEFSDDDPHKRAIKAALAGGKPWEGSIDQHLGHHLQGEAPFHALYSSLMGQHVNANIGDYQGPCHDINGGLVAPTWNPVTTYNQAFPNGIPQDEGPDPSVNHALESRLDVLGSVGGQLEAVKNHGGKEARRRLETYLASIEQLEGQTQGLIDSTPPELPVDLEVEVPENWAEPNSNYKYWQHSENFGPLGKIMMDTTVAALALDRTRVATMHWSASGTDKGPADGQHYQTLNLGLEGNNTQDHHMSHDVNEVKRRNQARVFRWYYTQLEYFVSRLKDIPDGEGSLFDSTLIVVCSEFGGYNHSFNDVPCALIGTGGGVVESGQYIDVHDGNFKPYSNLMLTLAQGFGMNINSFGHSSGTINQVLL